MLLQRVYAANTTPFPDQPLPNIQNPRPKIVLVGGTGRVGSSTASSLLKIVPAAEVSLGSRTRRTYDDALKRRPDLRNTTHIKLDVNDRPSIEEAILGADLVVHTAGPFQKKEDCSVLEAAISCRVPYLDVCDDTKYSCNARKLSTKAEEAGVPAIITGGIYPGVSNVMAAYMIESAVNASRADEKDDAYPLICSPSRILYSYYTAGTGGAGPTILETSFLLAGEPVIAYKDGQAITLPPVSNRRVVDFGRAVGKKSAYLYSLPEVSSGHEVFGVPNISARFGTSPEPWNWGMVALARLVPRTILQDRKAVSKLARLLDPVIRAIDGLVGEQVAMMVEVEFSNKKVAAGLFVHENLSESVGISTAAFAACMLAGETLPGVWYPEQEQAIPHREMLLKLASQGTRQFVLNKSPFQIATDPIELGFGIYLY
jgi:short subunit dehydrogenase-like uncharacterized protein